MEDKKWNENSNSPPYNPSEDDKQVWCKFNNKAQKVELQPLERGLHALFHLVICRHFKRHLLQLTQVELFENVASLGHNFGMNAQIHPITPKTKI